VQLPALRPKRFRAAGGCIDLAGVCGVAWGFLAYGADITGFALPKRGAIPQGDAKISGPIVR
jgi:hypothetical protein